MSVCFLKNSGVTPHLALVCVHLFSAQRVPVEALSSFLCDSTNVYTNLILLPLFAAVHTKDSIQEVLVTITFFS